VQDHVYDIELNNILRADTERLDFGETLRGWTKPALVIHGRFDAVLAPSIGWALHCMLPKSRMAFLERSGHMPFIEETDAFAAAVLGFLGDVDAGRVA